MAIRPRRAPSWQASRKPGTASSQLTDDSRPEPVGAILAALAANLAIATAKAAGAFYTGSGALFAETLHSIADTGNQGLLLFGLRQAKTPPSDDFPLGHGRAVYFWSFIVALLLFSLGGLVSIAEGVHKFSARVPLESPWVAAVILAVSVAAEASSLAVALRRINRLRRDVPLWRWFVDTRRSELMIVLGEDTAALAGLGVAIVAVALSIATGDPAYDAAGSVVVGALLVVVAFALAREIKGLLIGQSAHPRVHAAIVRLLAEQADVRRVHELITLQQGDEIFVAGRIELCAARPPRDAACIVARCKRALRAGVPEIGWILLEACPPSDGAADDESVSAA